uniref:Uncharacterized protein n=1 Tax=Amphimedon queenslandica TaxID=400682 RepID=A0A1X7TNU5_AMPQE
MQQLNYTCRLACGSVDLPCKLGKTSVLSPPGV